MFKKKGRPGWHSFKIVGNLTVPRNVRTLKVEKAYLEQLFPTNAKNKVIKNYYSERTLKNFLYFLSSLSNTTVFVNL